MISVHIDFRYFSLSGGLEDLFDGQKTLVLQIERISIKQLVFHLKDRHLRIKPEFFVSGEGL
jgi:hypothetical protein